MEQKEPGCRLFKKEKRILRILLRRLSCKFGTYSYYGQMKQDTVIYKEGCHHVNRLKLLTNGAKYFVCEILQSFNMSSVIGTEVLRDVMGFAKSCVGPVDLTIACCINLHLQSRLSWCARFDKKTL